MNETEMEIVIVGSKSVIRDGYIDDYYVILRPEDGILDYVASREFEHVYTIQKLY